MRRVPLGLWGLAVLSGVLQVLPFPIAGPVPLWRTHVCWIALVPLLWALIGDATDGRPVNRLQGAALGYASGFIWYMGSCYWIYQTMHVYGGLAKPIAAVIVALFSLYIGLYHALFGALVAAARTSRLGRQGALLLVPVFWVAVELARSRITSFPWDLLGVTQVDNPLLRQLAPWTGVCGISFVIAAVNALWLLRLQVRERRWTRPALVATGVVLIAGYSFAVLRPRPHARVVEAGTATLLQENLDVGAVEIQPEEGQAQMLEKFAALSRQPAATVLRGMPEFPGTRVIDRPRRLLLNPPSSAPLPGQEGRSLPRLSDAYERSDIIVWPESPAPFKERDPAFRTALGTLARQMGAPIIVGDIGIDQAQGGSMVHRPTIYNSASFIRPDGSFARRYDKMHLVPFGEYVPYKQLFFFAGSLLAEVGTFEPGVRRDVFPSGGHTYGTFICYESIFGDEIREFAKLGAEVLVNISNDGWYGDTSAPWQHLNMVRMRAIESHRWIVRATNTGITSVINPDGRVIASAPRHIRTAIRVTFGYEHDVTMYVRFGDWLPWSCAVLTIVAMGFAEWSRRTNRPGWRVL